MSTETLPLLVDADVRARLERVAAETGHSASALAGAVLREFLDEDDQFAAMVQEGIDEADAGKLISFEDFKADVAAQLAKLSAKP
jgi:predicted transcriptional regulator